MNLVSLGNAIIDFNEPPNPLIHISDELISGNIAILNDYSFEKLFDALQFAGESQSDMMRARERLFLLGKFLKNCRSNKARKYFW